MDFRERTVESLLIEIEELKLTIKELQEHLSKYTNSDRHKRYYQKNKERIKQNSLRYIEKLKQENPSKLKEYRHNAYIKRKEMQYNNTDYAS